jgi:preprotein translocase subunit SecD
MKFRLLAVVILIVAALVGFFDIAEFAGFEASSWARYFRLGLDLQGGVHLVYRADTSEIPSYDVDEAMNGVRDVIERRVNLYGVSEPVVQTEKVRDEQRLIVELAGVFDTAEAIELIGATPYLEFRELPRNEDGEIIATSTVLASDLVPSGLDGRYLSRASVQFDNLGAPLVAIDFDEAGSELFEEITERNLGEVLGIYIDGVAISVPVVQGVISGGQAQISGQFTIQEAKELARNLNAGALPVPIELISQQSVEPSLGRDSLARSLQAVLFGTLAIMIFMILWYRVPGLIAVFSILVYSIVVLFVFKMLPVTLSSAGIAGFLLSIGMAVDANILIFERMKEEIRGGRTVPDAVEEGFKRAWTSIRDANVSTLISATILYWFGTSLVRGFALTLGIGVLMSLLSAVFVSRTFLRAMPSGSGKVTRFFFGSGFGE